MRVVYWNNIPAPYMVERFNALVSRGNIELEVWFSTRRESDRAWVVDEQSWLFPYRYVGVGSSAAALAASHLSTDRPDVFFSLYERPEYIAGLMAARVAGCRIGSPALKTFDSWVKRRATREMAKRLLFPRMHAFHVAGADSASFVQRYGVPRERVHVLPEPVDVSHFHDPRAAAEARVLRSSLGLEQCTFLYVGRLWERKGLDFLFDAFEQVSRVEPGVSLLLVGDGVDEMRYQRRAASLPNVHFEAFRQKESLPVWYHAADVFVFPTLGDPYGHVVQEAMASGLPVIATTAAGDITDRVIEGETGFLVPPADADALASAMLKLSRESETRSAMAQAGYSRIAPRTIDWWARGFEELLLKVAAA
jgi:glycosyltransferase involved in cell wall biosynthesis